MVENNNSDDKISWEDAISEYRDFKKFVILVTGASRECPENISDLFTKMYIGDFRRENEILELSELEMGDNYQDENDFCYQEELDKLRSSKRNRKRI